MIDKEWAKEFAQHWIAAFNSHDLDQIFELYADDFIMSSPYIIERMGIEDGVLEGKDNVCPYWQKSLSISPRIQFKLLRVFAGVSTVVIHYESVGRKTVCETFTFDDQGKITSGNSQHMA